jgi:hypothetical protein
MSPPCIYGGVNPIPGVGATVEPLPQTFFKTAIIIFHDPPNPPVVGVVDEIVFFLSFVNFVVKFDRLF